MDHPAFVIITDEELQAMENEDIQAIPSNTVQDVYDVFTFIVSILIFLTILPVIMATVNQIEYGYDFWTVFGCYLLLELVLICICSVSLCICN